MKKEVMAYKSSKSPISEQFRTLRTNIQFMNVNKKMKVLHITSTFPNEGKSWVSSNLAVTFAQAGKKVILVDSDMRKGRQYAIFGVSPKPGLSNLLSQSEVDEEGKISENILDYIQPTEVENLQIITAGDVPPNPSELLVSAQMIGVLEELKKISDIVIIDGTPSEIVTDSVILSRLADSTVIVTAHKITKKDALDRVIKNIQNVGGNIAGVIINKVPVSSKKYDSRYYYYGKQQDLPEKKNKKAVKKEKSKKIKENKNEKIVKESKKDKKIDINKDSNSDLNKNETEKVVTENSEQIVNNSESVINQVANNAEQTWSNEQQENTNNYQPFSSEGDNNLNQNWNNQQQENTNNYQPFSSEGDNYLNQNWNNQQQDNTNNYQTFSNEANNNENQTWNNVQQENENNNNTQFGEQNNGYFNKEGSNVALNIGEQNDASKALEQTNLILQQINDYLNKEKSEQ